jgi:SAM-dependent methyltransferase
MTFYDGYADWKGWGELAFGKWSSVDGAYFSAELRRADIDSCAALRFYELGFGNGAFSGYVRSMGGEYFGSEINGNLLERAKTLGLNVFEGGIEQALAQCGRGSLDVVVAFDVLEHLDMPEIRSFLTDASELLRPGGIVLARVPSGDSPFGRAIFYGDITHCTALGSSAVLQLASQSGFEMVDIGPPRLPMRGVGPIRAMRRGGVRLAQTVIAYFINLVFHDGQPRVITANMVFVLRKPRR